MKVMEYATTGTKRSEKATHGGPACRRCSAYKAISGLEDRLESQRRPMLVTTATPSVSTPFHLQAQEKPNSTPLERKKARRATALMLFSLSAAVKASNPKIKKPTKKMSIKAARAKTNRKLFRSVKSAAIKAME